MGGTLIVFTAYLDWTSAVAWSTPIPETLLTYEAKIDFLPAYSSFGV